VQRIDVSGSSACARRDVVRERRVADHRRSLDRGARLRWPNDVTLAVRADCSARGLRTAEAPVPYASVQPSPVRGSSIRRSRSASFGDSDCERRLPRGDLASGNVDATRRRRGGSWRWTAWLGLYLSWGCPRTAHARDGTLAFVVGRRTTELRARDARYAVVVLPFSLVLGLGFVGLVFGAGARGFFPRPSRPGRS